MTQEHLGLQQVFKEHQTGPHALIRRLPQSDSGGRGEPVGGLGGDLDKNDFSVMVPRLELYILHTAGLPDRLPTLK